MRRSREERQARRADAEREAAWFYGTLQGNAENAPAPMRARAVALEDTLRSLSSFHRGALSIWHREKTWPEALRKKFGAATSLVVRLACATTPSVGATEALEAAAAERLLAWMAGGGSEKEDDTLDDLEGRADMYRRRALRALAKALPSMSPAKPARSSGPVDSGDAAERA